jgi:hypothetical protein
MFVVFGPNDHRLLYPLEPVRSGDVAEELRGRRAALGDEHVGVGLEVVEQMDTVGRDAEGRGGEDGDAAGLDAADDGCLVSNEELEWMIPRPPMDAIAAAMAPSTTVSIGEERTGERGT